jgi:hypothetical protein
MTGKRGLWRARSSSSSRRRRRVRDVGCPEEPTSPVSFPLPAGISKSGVLPLAAVQNHVGKTLIGPLPRSVVGRNDAVVRSLIPARTPMS